MGAAFKRRPVVVHRVHVARRAGETRLTCRVSSGHGRLPSSLWLRFPGEVDPFIRPDADPFVPPLLVHCMRARRPLVIDGEVSARLLSALPLAQDLYAQWAAADGSGLVRVDVSAPSTVRQRQAGASGAFFSGGVDSFYTLLRNRQRYEPGDPRRIAALLLVHGFDIPLSNRRLFEEVERQTRRVAHQVGARLIAVETNIRTATDDLDWGRYGHGAALASVGLALGRLVHTVYVPSTSAIDELTPWGSHPALDPLWSTEAVDFVHDGGEANRDRKIELLASSPVALESLRVCWENRAGAYNCGRCEKCLRTMIELQLCGALERAARFPRAIAAADVARLTIPPNCRKYWRRMLDARHRLSGDLAVAIDAALQRRAEGPARLTRIGLRSGGLSRLLRRLRQAATPFR
jgi:hypothetical protein